MKYYVSVDGIKRKGPFSREEIESMLLNETVDESTSIWRRGLDDWTPLAKVHEFENLIEELPPPLIAIERSKQKKISVYQVSEGFVSPFTPSSFVGKNYIAFVLSIAFFVLALAANIPPLTSFVETAENNRVYLLKNPDCHGFWPFVEFTTKNVVKTSLKNNKSQANTATKELYDALQQQGLYSKSYFEFHRQFATVGAQKELYEGLHQKNLYSKAFEDFQYQFFTPSHPKPDPARDDFMTKQVFNGLFAGWSLLEWLVYFGFLWLGVFKRKWRISSWIAASLFVIVSWIGWYLHQWYMGALLTEGLGYEIVFSGMISWRQSVIAGLFGGICSIAVTYALAVVLTRIFKRSRNFKSGIFLVICVLIACRILSCMSHLGDVIDKPRSELLENMEKLRSKIESQ